MIGVARGFQYFVKSVKLITSDVELKKLAFFPVLIFVVLLVLGLFAGLFYIDDLLNMFFSRYIEHLESYWRAAIYIFGFFVFGFIYYIFSFIMTSVISIPVCAAISDKTLKSHTGLLLKDKGFKESVMSFFKMLKAGIAKVLLLILIGFILFITSFIPVLAPLAFFGSIIILSFDSMDFAFESLDYGFKQRILFLKNHMGVFAGFSLGLSILIVIPFVQFIVLPVAVCGTTLFLAEEIKIKSLKG